jgi:hypothetical protein
VVADSRSAIRASLGEGLGVLDRNAVREQAVHVGRCWCSVPPNAMFMDLHSADAERGRSVGGVHQPDLERIPSRSTP